MSEQGRQAIVYSMTLEAKEPLAMVLPIPVAKGSGEGAVRFINLEKYPDFFVDMYSGFPEPVSAGRAPARGVITETNSVEPLRIHSVGSFEASFVPTRKDFSRLDLRFRLPDSAFVRLPQYQDYGFAVFKLKAGIQKLHPMAFEFPTALPTKLFFPTVHIHDGQVHPEEQFEHLLYCQPSEVLQLKLADWRESERLARQFMNIPKTAGIVGAGDHCYRLPLNGMLPNRDTFVELRT